MRVFSKFWILQRSVAWAWKKSSGYPKWKGIGAEMCLEEIEEQERHQKLFAKKKAKGKDHKASKEDLVLKNLFYKKEMGRLPFSA